MRRIVGYLVVSLTLVIVTEFLCGWWRKKEPEAVTAFVQTESETRVCSLESYFYLGDKYMLPEEKKATLSEIFHEVTEEMDREGSPEFHGEGYGSETRIRLKYTGEEIDFQGEIITNEIAINNHVSRLEQYLLVKISYGSNVEQGWKCREKLKKILEKISGNEQQVSFVIDDGFGGELTENTKKMLAQNMFERMNGKQIFWGEDGKMEYLYGYSTKLKEYRKIQGEKINFQLAFSYDEEKDVTHLYIGIPFLNQDY